MGLEKLIKREMSITIATVLLVTTIFIMFSYAIFKVEDEGEQNTITFGKIEMAFCANKDCSETENNIGNIIGTTDKEGVTSYVPIYPHENPTYNNQDKTYGDLTPYIFKLTNTGDLPLYITVYLDRDTTAGITLTQDDVGKTYKDQVPDNQIMIAFGESGTNPTPKNYSETKKEEADNQYIIGENIELAAGASKTFNLYAWLVPNAENASQGKIFVTQISAKGEYKPEQGPEA